MRQAYKVSHEYGDGKPGGLIYVGPAGQTTGSLQPPHTLQIPVPDPGPGTPASTMAANSAQKPRMDWARYPSDLLEGYRCGAQSGTGNMPAGTPPANGRANPQTGGTRNRDGLEPLPAATDASGAASGDSAMSTPQSITSMETPTIIGRKYYWSGEQNQRAVGRIVYEKAKN